MEPVNIFFSCDDNYFPFLAVTLASIRRHADPGRDYDIRILNTGLRAEYMARLEALFASEHFAVSFYNITAEVALFSRRLHTRDYYSQSTYYRLFIPELFPELDKALYLDSDLLLLEDAAQLYDIPLGEHLVAAAPDGIIGTVPDLALYAGNRLGVEPEEYFNAGVLLMNLEKMRQTGFQQMFSDLLSRVTFQVAQDQDYLNVICNHRAVILDPAWNTMPTGFPVEKPKLIHFNLDSKPWHRDGVPYGDLFWEYAAESGFYPEILQIRRARSDADIRRSAQGTVELIAMGRRQALDETENRSIHTRIAEVVGL